MSKKDNNENNNDIQINLRDSSVTEFTKKPVPKQNEVEEFEEIIEDEARDEEIDQGLTEIYQDDEGHLVDVHKLEKIKKHSIILSIVNFLFVIMALGGGGYWLYDNWYKNASFDASKISIKIEGDKEVVAGEEFEYKLVYVNESRVTLENVRVNVTLPNNYILLESDDDFQNNSWEVGRVEPFTRGDIVLKGQMLGAKDANGVISAYLTYSPEGLSSEYKKEAFVTTMIIDTGLDIDFDFLETALVGEIEDMSIHFSANEKSYIKDFRISVEPQENIEIFSYIPDDINDSEQNYASYTIDRAGIWEVNGVLDEEQVLPIQFKVVEKNEDKQKLIFKFEKKDNIDEEYYEFYREEIELNIMKSDLNLTMIVNGERESKGVDFGELLNFSIVYNNKGDSDVNDVVVMAVLDGDFLDWTTLQDLNQGRERGNTITWSKEEIPALALVSRDQEGVIDFSINVADFGAVDLEKDYGIETYAQVSFGGEDISSDEQDNKSNAIKLQINSDLSFTESLRYFNEDNIPVGSGPNPPQVDKTTTYKVYWDIENNLHELNKLAVSLKLPDYIKYEDKSNATIGSLIYSEEGHELVWNIGRLPVSVYEASAYFSVSVTPSEDDENKIMVVLPGSNVQAVDAVTETELKISSKAKTTKLEDDEIGGSHGLVE
ncbi:hypothetical protein C0583_02505 [Candidatus Parcubacteria bacterium]|nr:MAG: hypothetical protein C0583_02505 [Candidatus Parcubacteria bacterium]